MFVINRYRQQITEVWARSEAFTDITNVRDIFQGSELQTLRESAYDLGDTARTPRSRAQQVLMFFTEVEPEELRNECLLEFCQLLEDRERETSRARVQELVKALRAECPIELNVVVAAMSASQAGDLLEGRVALAAEVEAKLRQLTATATSGFGVDKGQLLAHYQPQRDQWRPLGEEPVLSLVTRVFREVEEHYRRMYRRSLPTIRLLPITEQCFDTADSAEVAQALSDRRLLLIIDAVSLLHPEIKQRVRLIRLEGAEGAQGRTAVITMLPGGRYLELITDLHELFLQEFEGLRARHLRPHSFDDLPCEIDYLDQKMLFRRLGHLVPQIVQPGLRPSTPTSAASQEMYRVGSKNLASELGFSPPTS